MQMGAMRRIMSGGDTNKAKGSQNGQTGHHFGMSVQRGKMQEVGRDCYGGLEGIMWRNRGKERGVWCDTDGHT